MKQLDLDRLKLKQLIELRTKVQQAIAVRKTEQKVSLRAKIEEMASAAGLSLSDILAIRKKTKVRGNSPIKYRHPKDPSLTWTGRGRKPKCILQAGGNVERFLQP